MTKFIAITLFGVSYKFEAESHPDAWKQAMRESNQITGGDPEDYVVRVEVLAIGKEVAL